MSDKSYVTMEQHICEVCGAHFDTGSLLLDRRVRPVFERTTTTGWGLCPDHRKLFDDGYIALVAVDRSKSGGAYNSDTLKREEAYRTGAIAHLRRERWSDVFNSPVPVDRGGNPIPLCFVDPQVIDMLAQASEQPAPS